MRFINENGVEVVTEDMSKIEEIVIAFYDALFNGRHDGDLVDSGEPFQPSNQYLEEFLDQLPTLSEESKLGLVKEMTFKELESIVKSCPNGKSPGLDGLPYEFYKSMWSMITASILDQIGSQRRIYRDVLFPTIKAG